MIIAGMMAAPALPGRNEKSGSDDDKSFDASEDSFDPDNVPDDDDDDAASAVSFDPERGAGSKVASEKSFDPDRVEDEQDLSGFDDEGKESVATISADIAQRVRVVCDLAQGSGVMGEG